jgi:site-specific recombinase XerD
VNITDSIINFRRYLKRKNYSRCTVRDYMSTLKGFVLWVNVPIEEVDRGKVLSFIDHLLNRRLSPKSINCCLDTLLCAHHSVREVYLV